jgi:hypothetical protein
MVTWPIL